MKKIITIILTLTVPINSIAGSIVHFSTTGEFQKIEKTSQTLNQGVIHFEECDYVFKFNDYELFLNDMNSNYFNSETSSISLEFKIITDSEIDDVLLSLQIESLKESLTEKNFKKKLEGIYKKSQLGDFDFSTSARSYILNTEEIYIDYFILNGTAYDNYDFGNYIWGYVMRILDIPFSLSKIGSEYNAFLFGDIQNKNISQSSRPSWDGITWSGDSQADQNAIKRGYFSSSEEKIETFRQKILQ